MMQRLCFVVVGNKQRMQSFGQYYHTAHSLTPQMTAVLSQIYV